VPLSTTMKHIFALVIALSLPALALPPDAADIKTVREIKLSDLNGAYIRALEKCQKRAMAAGDFGGAKEIEAEIGRVTNSEDDATTYAGSVWHWGSGGILKLLKNGKAIHTSWTMPGKWLTTPAGLSVKNSDGQNFSITFSDDGVGTVVLAGGGTTLITRKR
jgi:hypothetical protein